MSASQEVVLAHLQGDSQHERVEVVLFIDASGSCVCLRQQSWAAGIGWFTQSSVTMSPQQVKHLQRALGRTPSAQQKRFSSPRATCRELEAPTVIPFPGSIARNEH